MKPTLLQAQIRAWLIGLLWFIPFLILVRLFEPYGLFVLLGFPVLVAFLTAVVAGPYDRLTFVSCFVPIAYMIAFDIHTLLLDCYGPHAIHGTILGPSPIFDFLAGVIPAVIGLGLKRLFFRRGQNELTPSERSVFYSWLAADLGFLILIPAVLVGIDIVKVSQLPTPEQFARLQVDLLASPTSTDQQRIQAMIELQRSHFRDQDANIIPALQQAFQSPSSDVKFAAAVYLLSKGDGSSLAFLEDRLSHSADVTLRVPNWQIETDWLGYGRGSSFVRFNLGSSLSGIHDPGAAPILARLLGSSDVEVRRGAASALRDMADSQAIDALLVALNDSDREVRYLAMGALMTATDDPHYPSTTLFYADEAAYLNPWKKWDQDRSLPPPRSKPF